MQILVLSDSHGKYDTMRDVLLAHGDAAMAIHCGDGEQDVMRFLEEFPNRCGWLHIVRGNCDHSEAVPTTMTFQLPYGHRAFVIHGHAQMYGDSTSRLVQLAKSQGADILLYGHSHNRSIQTVSNVLLLNPGSTAQPRDGLPASYALLDVTPSGVFTAFEEVRNASLEYMHVI